MKDIFKDYLKDISNNLKRGDATEHTHRSALKFLIENNWKRIVATNEPKHEEFGAPDYIVSRKTKHGPLTIGRIEAKDVGKNLSEVEKSDQLKRYLKHVDNLVLTDYLEFRWYVEGERRLKARLGEPGPAGKIYSDENQWKDVYKLLDEFLSHAPEPITKPKKLAVRMAKLTHMVRDMVIEVFEKDKPSRLLEDLRNVFAKRLIPDLNTPEKIPQFADMYAQTITYGLFAARCNHKGDERFRRTGAAAEIPKTNPFLRSMLGSLTGPDLDDEPYAGFVNDIADLLADAGVKEILSEFGKHMGRKDPVMHFYETFLAAYDPKVRERRGVYYTPEPVVRYIVKSVDHLLKKRFRCRQGLADTTTIEYEKKNKLGDIVNKEKVTVPKVLILDPACGTGTFLYKVVYRIRKQFEKRRNAGLWSGYVRNHLLNRLFGFELLMAPYAIAHFKLGMQLAGYDMEELIRDKWAYDFEGDERLGIYLTNTLEAADKVVTNDLLFIERKVVDEANAAARIKRDLPIMVIMGNPPYSGISANMGPWIDGLLKGELPSGEKVSSYYEVDGKPLGEKKVWLQDDYVKFIRWAQWRIERTGKGILGFITNHAYLDNPTFRGMRQQLMKTFNEIYILDLHGSTKKKEVCPDGSKDENVFDIQQGVAIGIFVKLPGDGKTSRIYHADLWGLRDDENRKGAKYPWLLSHDVANTEWVELHPQSPFYLFIARDTEFQSEFLRGWKVTNIFPVSTTGIVTARDHFVFDFDRKNLLARIDDFRSKDKSEEQIRSKYFKGKSSPKYPPGDTRGWKMQEARNKVRDDDNWKNRIIDCLYRPFDIRPLYYVPWMVDWPRPEVMRHVLPHENLGLVFMRQVALQETYSHFGISRLPVDNRAFYSNKGIMSFAPLYLYPDPEKPLADNFNVWPKGKKGRVPNLDKKFVEEFVEKLKLSFVSDGKGDLKKIFGPEDILHYIYAVFHSPTYRKRYAEFLKIDFPRVPLTSKKGLFRKLVALGGELVSLHLLESPKVGNFKTQFPERGTDVVEKGYPKYVEKEKAVYINEQQYFEGVPKEVWEFQVGGYQVCRKWLKDRKGRKLSYNDCEHYRKIVVALSETIRIMAKIDKTIPSWPIK